MLWRRLFLALMLCAVAEASAQTLDRRPWEEVYEELTTALSADDDDDGTAVPTAEENYELLQQMADHPLDLNTATREELEQLPFLTDMQVADLIAYRDRYGSLRSMAELRMLRSMDYAQLALLPYFASVNVVGNDVADYRTRFPRLDTIARHGRHQLTATARLPFYDRRGDRNGYLGYKYRHWLRYEFSYGQRLRFGLTASQDAGEPFMAGRNRWGYDSYGYYLELQRLTPLMEQLLVGKYRLTTGMGLIANSSFSLGKLATLQSLGRTTRTLRPHTSRSEADYLQGVATTLRLARPLRLTAFVSYRPIDATLNSDSLRSAATLITSGYHRTPTEMLKKHNTHLTTAGAALSLRTGGFRLGANAVYTHIDRPLEPNRQTLYRRHYAHGSNFTNASIDYAYTHHYFAVSGETATDAHGHLATLNALSLRPSESVAVVALQRFYSYRYTSLHAHAFSEGGHVQNESGLYLGLTWTPLRRLQLQAYADYASFPWARYLVSQPSHAVDLLVQAQYTPDRWTLTARYRAHLRQKDNADKTALTSCDDHRLRLTAVYVAPKGWSAKTQADCVQNVYKQTSRGFALSEQLGWQRAWLTLSLSAAYFDTDDYQSRISLYERHLYGDFAFPTYYGQGIRLALMATANPLRSLQLSLRLGYTDYFDRPTIGTALQQVDHSSLTDLDLQLRWKF